MRKRWITIVVALFTVIGVGSAAAATSLQHSTTGAKFGISQAGVGNGYWEWYGNGVSCGGSCVGGFH